jgi:hypothetical protein
MYTYIYIYIDHCRSSPFTRPKHHSQRYQIRQHFIERPWPSQD